MTSIRSRRVYVGKRLKAASALRKALKKSPGDHRGFRYNPITGYVVLT